MIPRTSPVEQLYAITREMPPGLDESGRAGWHAHPERWTHYVINPTASIVRLWPPGTVIASEDWSSIANVLVDAGFKFDSRRGAWVR